MVSLIGIVEVSQLSLTFLVNGQHITIICYYDSPALCLVQHLDDSFQLSNGSLIFSFAEGNLCCASRRSFATPMLLDDIQT